MYYLVVFLLIIIAVWAMIVYLDRVKYATDIRALQGSIGGYEPAYFSREMLKGLPDPVHKYLEKVIPEGFPLINMVHLTHTGRFRPGPDKEWTAIKGEQYFTARVPGFIWRGKTNKFTADDRYFADRGSLTVKLFSILPVMNATGEYIDEGELQRWLGEQFWLPTNLLNQNLLHWESIDDRSSRLTLRYRDFEIPVTYHFDDDNLIEKVTCRRFIDKERKMDWSGHASEYEWVDGLLVPTRVMAKWHPPEGVYAYADFDITSITFLPEPELNTVKERETALAY